MFNKDILRRLDAIEGRLHRVEHILIRQGLAKTEPGTCGWSIFHGYGNLLPAKGRPSDVAEEKIEALAKHLKVEILLHASVPASYVVKKK